MRSRVTGQVSSRRNLCREPQRIFRRHIACTFQVAALADILCVDVRWLLNSTSTMATLLYSLINSLRWLKLLHQELTEVLRRVVGLCDASTVDIFPQTSAAPTSFVGVSASSQHRIKPSIFG